MSVLRQVCADFTCPRERICGLVLELAGPLEIVSISHFMQSDGLVHVVLVSRGDVAVALAQEELVHQRRAELIEERWSS